MKRTLYCLLLGVTVLTIELPLSVAQTRSESGSATPKRHGETFGSYFSYSSSKPAEQPRGSEPAPVITAEDLQAGLSPKKTSPRSRSQAELPTAPSPVSIASPFPAELTPTSKLLRIPGEEDEKPVPQSKPTLASRPKRAFAERPAAFTSDDLALGDDLVPAPYGDETFSSIGQPACDTCGVSCCSCGWKHRVSIFGEYLYLRVRDNEVPYAVEFDGPLDTPTESVSQQGPVGIVDQDYSSAFRAGFDVTMDCDTAIRASYTYFDTSRDQTLARQDINNVVRSLVRHPSSINVASDGPFASARHDIRMDLIDVEYRRLWDCGCDYELTWLVGFRYGHLEQNFESVFGGNGIDAVETELDFDGGGIRLGVEGERRMRRHLMVYGKAAVSLLAGEFTADYLQQSATDPVVVNTNWNAGRVVSIWDLEFGGGLISRCGNWRLTAGYVFSLWDNVVKTDEWIDGVQRNDYEHLGDRMTLDGLVGRAEFRF